MRCREVNESRIPLRELQPALRKNIRKASKPNSRKRQSAETARTLSDTLTKSTYDENKPCATVTTSVSIEPFEKSFVISPLKDILSGSSKKEPLESALEDQPEQVHCKYIAMDDPETCKKPEFKLFKEKDVALFTQTLTNVKLNDPGCDNDCQTDDEQIKTAMRFVQREIEDTLENYNKKRKEVRNIAKYECDRVIAAKKHRIY